MEAVLEGLGIAALSILAVIGLAIGAVAGAVTNRSKLLYAAIGAVAAMATPFVLAALGVTLVAVGGLLLVLLVGAVGAAVVVALVRAATHRR